VFKRGNEKWIVNSGIENEGIRNREKLLQNEKIIETHVKYIFGSKYKHLQFERIDFYNEQQELISIVTVWNQKGVRPNRQTDRQEQRKNYAQLSSKRNCRCTIVRVYAETPFERIGNHLTIYLIFLLKDSNPLSVQWKGSSESIKD